MLIDRIKSGTRLIAGLDIGTSKVCVVVGEILKDGISIVSLSSVPSYGVKKGVINDAEAAASSIRKAISSAEKLVGKAIDEVYTGISGTHIKSVVSMGSSSITGNNITDQDIDRALESAVNTNSYQDMEIIQILPSDFLIDRQGGISNPIGMSGDVLEVEAQIFVSDKSSLENLILCCEIAEVKIADIIIQALASAEASLTPQERENGAAVIDIGGGITEIAIYKHNLLKQAIILGIGGNHFTNDLSIVLGIPFQEAERIKINNGYIMTEAPEGGNGIDTLTADGNSKKLHQKDISEILSARSQELLELIRKEIKHSVSLHSSLTGVILSGGACLLPGFREMAEEILTIPVRIAYPELVSKKFNKNIDFEGQHNILHSVVPEFNQPIYTAGIGLVMYGAGHQHISEKTTTHHLYSSGITNKMAEWFKNIR